MTTVTNPTNTAPATGTAGTTRTTGTSSSGTTTAAEQQDRFMKLLVAQMKNQDPLNPMDNAQMTSQVAQINTVSGIEKLNSTVQSLLGSFQSLQAQSAAQLPGRNVLVTGTSLELADGAAHGGIELAGAADTVNVDIVDANGAVVKRVALGQSAAGIRNFAWDGKTTAGADAPAGAYRMRVAATQAGTAVAATTLTSARVVSVSNTSAGVQVDLGSAGVRPYSDLKSFL